VSAGIALLAQAVGAISAVHAAARKSVAPLSITVLVSQARDAAAPISGAKPAERRARALIVFIALVANSAALAAAVGSHGAVLSFLARW
jgi:hypothetical protein